MKALKRVAMLSIVGCVAGLGVAAIGQQPPAVRPANLSPRTTKATKVAARPQPAKKGIARILSQNPTLLPYLLKEATVEDEGDIDARESVAYALAVVVPHATDQLIEALEGKDPTMQKTALGLLTSAIFPEAENARLVPVMLRLAQSKGVDNDVRVLAKVALCNLLTHAAQREAVQNPYAPSVSRSY